MLLALSVACFAAGYRIPALLGTASVAEGVRGVMPLARPRYLDDFALRDQHGGVFDRSRLTGRWTFLVFGYSRCPDVCPMTLQVLGGVLAQLSPFPRTRLAPQIVLVSVDGARDTPDVLARFLARFDAPIVGLTGEPSQVDRLAGSIAVHYATRAGGGPGGALIDHTALVALIDTQGRLRAGFAPPYDVEAIAAEFRTIAAWTLPRE